MPGSMPSAPPTAPPVTASTAEHELATAAQRVAAPAPWCAPGVAVATARAPADRMAGRALLPSCGCLLARIGSRLHHLCRGAHRARARAVRAPCGGSSWGRRRTGRGRGFAPPRRREPAVSTRPPTAAWSISAANPASTTARKRAHLTHSLATRGLVRGHDTPATPADDLWASRQKRRSCHQQPGSRG